MQNNVQQPHSIPDLMPPEVPKTHNHTSFKIIIAILTVLVLALAGFLICHFVTADHTTVSSGNLDTSLSIPSGDDDLAIYQQEQAVIAVIDKIYNKANALFNRNGSSEYYFAGLNRYTIYYNHDSYAVSYQPEGYIIGVPLNRAYGLSVNSSVIQYHKDLFYNDASEKAMDDYLSELGFTSTGETYTTASAGPSSVTYQNLAAGIICSKSTFWDIACGYQNWYNKTDADFSNELAEAYEAATGEDAHYLVARVSDITDGAVSPYQTVQVAMTGSGALFYRTSPDNPWVFAFRGQDGPTCDEYNTQDLKNAFAGQACWDKATSTYIKVQL